MAVQKAPLEFGVFGYRKEREIEAPAEMGSLLAKVVDKKAVDTRGMTIAGGFTTQIGHTEPHEDVPDTRGAYVGVVVSMTRSQNAYPH
jgi:hypothetical protein